MRRTFLKQAGLLGAASLLSQRALGHALATSLKTDEDLLRDARKAIPALRGSTLRLQLLRADGKPLANTPVQLLQQGHSFAWGDNSTSLWSLLKNQPSMQQALATWTKRYTQVLNAMNCTCYWTERENNTMTRTEDQQGEYFYQPFHQLVHHARGLGLQVKGHPLFWPVDKAMPQWLQRYPYETQMKFVEVRVRSLVARYRGVVDTWDVVNEMLWEPHPRHLAQRHWPHIEPIDTLVEYIAPILRWAREENPAATLLLNEYGIEADEKKDLKAKDGQPVTALSQRRRYLQLVQALGQLGAAPSALGLQCHSGGWLLPGLQLQFLNEMATAGLPLHITEFWAHTSHLQASGMALVAGNGDFRQEPIKPRPGQKTYDSSEIDAMQADHVERYLTMAYAHPAVQAFYFWGFWNDATTRGHNGETLELKPYYHRVHQLLRQQWHSQHQVVTDEQGRLACHAYHGHYHLQYPVAQGGPPAALSFAVLPHSMPSRLVCHLA